MSTDCEVCVLYYCVIEWKRLCQVEVRDSYRNFIQGGHIVCMWNIVACVSAPYGGPPPENFEFLESLKLILVQLEE